MANPIKGEVSLVLSDGRNLTIVADNGALVRGAQAHTGRTKIGRFLADLQPLTDDNGVILLDEDGDPVKDTFPPMCALFFGCLDAHHPDLTLRDATNIMVAELEKVTIAVTEAMALAWPSDVTPSAEGNAPAPKKGRAGKSSGSSGAKRA